MFSRLLNVFISIVIFSALGCGLKLGEKNKTENIAEIKGVSCLKQSVAEIKLFISGDASDEQVSESLLCVQNVIVAFKENIRGKDQNSYTPGELAIFLTKQFSKDGTEFSPALLAEVMKLKVALVGGDASSLSKSEIDGISNLIARLKPELVRLNPHMKVIVSKWTPDADALGKEKKFLDAKAAFEVFLNRLALLLAATERSYEINDLINLVIEAAKFSKSDDQTIKKIVNAKTLSIRIKEMLIGGNSALVGREWVPFAKTLGEAFFQLLRYKYFFNDLKENQIAEKWKVHRVVSKDVLELVSDLLGFKESHVFTSKELSLLILTAQDLGFINSKPTQKKFDQKGLGALFDALWKNILNPPENRIAKKVLSGFNSTALQVLGEELGHWMENQISIAELYTDKNEYNKNTLIDELSRKTKSTAQQELYKVVAANGLMNFNEKGYLKILSESNGLYHIKDLYNANLTRSISRVIIRSYANDIVRVNSLAGITLDEAQLAFDQLKDLLLNLELVDPANTAFISSRFNESNLFLSVSNGDKTASFEEINHLVLHILSGIQRADSLKVLALQKCLKVKSDMVSKTELGQNCLLDLYFNEENSFADLPGFAKIKIEKNENGDLKFSPEQNKSNYLGLLKAAGYIPNEEIPEEQRTVFLGDADLFPHVVQYVEMIYFTHDSNHDGYLQKDEAIKAYPVFQETIKLLKNTHFFKDLEEKDFMGAFVWLLKKGTPFPVGTMKKFAKDYECNLNNDSKTCTYDWTIEASRIDIGKIFTLIASMTKPKPPEAPPVPKP